jgi:nitroreductase
MTVPAPSSSLAFQRRSTRAFLPRPVAPELLRSVLIEARQAPSGANLQPGAFVAVQGEVRRGLCTDLVAAWRAGEQEREDYDYFPNPLPMTLRRRQVASAQALYGAIGVERAHRAGRDAQFENNFRFFDAPVALVVTIDREFGSGGYMDLGMALYGFMLAAQGKGLATCAIGALASFPSLVRRHLQLDETSNIVCGLALGYADPTAPVNRAQTTRCALDEYFRVVG